MCLERGYGYMRTKLADRQLPNYTRGEEIFNMVSHIVGAAGGVAVLVLCVIEAALNRNVYGVVSSVIYGATMIMLYTMSSIYHGLKGGTAKKVFQVIDHCTIYLLIAGTYTPIALSAIRSVNPVLGWTLFGVEWAFAALAITLTAIDLEHFGVFSMICYIGMGWSVIVIYKAAFLALTLPGVILLFIGGVFYTIGAILYGLGSTRKYMHNIFHVFVIIGSVMQFLAILFYAL